jgi:hypothetical protein
MERNADVVFDFLAWLMTMNIGVLADLCTFCFPPCKL